MAMLRLASKCPAASWYVLLQPFQATGQLLLILPGLGEATLLLKASPGVHGPRA